MTKLVKRFVYLIVMTAGILIAGQPPNFAVAGPSKNVKDWYAYCSDSLVCSFSSEAKGEGVYSIEFERGIEADAPIVLKIAIKGNVNEETEVAVSIPGYLDEMYFQFSDGEFENGQWEFSTPAIFSALLPAMRAGASMQIHVQTNEGDFSPNISLSGLTAVMLFLDEAQGRLDRVDALVAKGSKPAVTRATRVVELSASSELPPSIMQRWTGHPDQCAEFDGDLIKAFGGIKLSIDPNKDVHIYIIPCGGPGAYNLTYAAFVYDQQSGQSRTLSMPTMSNKGPTIMDSLINMSWDETSSRLSAFYKGRGFGDCGIASQWEWNELGQYGNFILVEERAKGDCDGKQDEWPLVWPQK